VPIFMSCDSNFKLFCTFSVNNTVSRQIKVHGRIVCISYALERVVSFLAQLNNTSLRILTDRCSVPEWQSFLAHESVTSTSPISSIFKFVFRVVWQFLLHSWQCDRQPPYTRLLTKCGTRFRVGSFRGPCELLIVALTKLKKKN
jgi:hypothetical protein